jgi:LacI family transcriptional regulator
MATMRDVAALAQVSGKTVSRVFNDDPHVLPETRARVEAALRELDYVPNAMAISFRQGRSSVIGIAVPDIVDPFFASIAKAVEKRANQHDMSTLVASLGDEPAHEQRVIESLLRRQLAGLIVAPIATDQHYLTSWARRIPTVFVDRDPTNLRADSFVGDDQAGAFEAVNHLVAHGHRAIAFVGGSLQLPTIDNRMAGYCAALDANAIPFDPELVVWDADNRLGAVRAVAALQGLSTPPSAIFSSDARCSMALVPALTQLQMAVVGYGDFPLADMLSPALTVIDQDPQSLGRLAAEHIFARIRHPNKHLVRRSVLAVTLIERESCAVAGPTGQGHHGAGAMSADNPIHHVHKGEWL